MRLCEGSPGSQRAGSRTEPAAGPPAREVITPGGPPGFRLAAPGESVAILPAVMPRLASLSPVRNLRYLGELVRWTVGVARAVRRRQRETRVTVAVDVSPFWERLTGIGWYLYRLMEHLSEEGADRDDLVLRLYGPDLVRLPGTPEPAVAPPSGAAIEHVSYDFPAPPGVALARLAERAARLLAPLLLSADGNDLVFAPNYFPPRRFELALAAGTPLVATVHDLGYRKVPWAIRRETLDDLERHMPFVWSRAALILTDAEAVRREMLDAGLAGPGRVRAIHLAPAHPPLPEEVAARAPIGIGPPAGTPERYVLFVGTVEPRKNLGVLLDAWRRLRLEEPPALVVCGRVGWVDEETRAELRRAEAAGWLVHFDYAEDAGLAALYRGALAVALPSWYEGFGLPALEACAAGAPVLASDLPVLREVLGDAALYAPPDDPAAWAAAVERVAGEPDLTRGLAGAGRARVGAFDWRRTADETARALLDTAPS
jgi:glycosyltransferase involved in cell wall biosynthesis